MSGKINRQAIIRAICAMLVSTAAAIPMDLRADPSPQVLGASMGVWTARWWTWALEIPASRNPLLDTNGAFCAQDQQGPVWFLAGAWGSGTAVRTCTIPRSRSILFPIANFVWVQTSGDVPSNSEADYRNCAAGTPQNSLGCAGVQPVAGRLQATLDGVPVVFDQRTPIVRTQSPLFHVTWPEGNVFGLDPGAEHCSKCGQSVSDGFWVMLPPLDPGAHVLKFSASDGTTEWQNLTYNLIIR